MRLRKYPVGIQSFETIRRDGYIYIDKTPLIYKMISEGKPYFLSRPRRFGKSLLCSTLAAVFKGRRELFEAFTTDDGVEHGQRSCRHRVTDAHHHLCYGNQIRWLGKGSS